MTRVVFSRDRAMQLDAFLRSYEAHVAPRGRLTVLFRATSRRHAVAYSDVFSLHPWVDPLLQSGSMKEDLLGIIPVAGDAILFADDHAFLRPWAAEPGVNLHLGLHLTRCYTMDAPQPVPPHALVEPDKVTWRWRDGQGDWGYPLALCGQAFRAEEIRPLIASSSFHSPNSLEFALQRFAPQRMDRFGVCYRESRLVLLPWNLVQTDCANRAASAMPDAEEMLDYWEEGHRVDIASMYGVLTESVHQELPLVLERR